MYPANAKYFVDAEFPATMRAHIPAALKTAYEAVNALYKSEPLFQVQSAQVGKGHVIGWAVDLQFERLIIAGKLPFDYSWVSYERPTGQYLQIRLSSSTLSINQLPKPTALPRRAVFRQNRALNNAPFLDFREFDNERGVAGLPHLILGHGYQELLFAQIGVPAHSPQCGEWIYRTSNLLNAPHLVGSDGPEIEAADVEAIVTLREELTRWARDHGNDG